MLNLFVVSKSKLITLLKLKESIFLCLDFTPFRCGCLANIRRHSKDFHLLSTISFHFLKARLFSIRLLPYIFFSNELNPTDRVTTEFRCFTFDRLA